MSSIDLTPDAFVPIPAILEAHARTTPDATAFQVDGQVLSWKALHDATRRVARRLERSGVQPGDAVALLGAPSTAYVECLFGALLARACVVPLPSSATPDNLEALLADCEARVLFVDPDAGGAIAAMVERLGRRSTLSVVPFGQDMGVPVDDAPFTPTPARRDDRFNIIYSSGTTGLPKGIVHLHGMRQQQAARNSFGFSPRSVTLLSTPMYSNTTLLPMLGTLVHGGTCILMGKFDAGRFLALAAAHRATHTMLVPVQYERILAHADFARTDLTSLELSQCTGAPMALSLKQDIVRRWPGRFLEVYGLTEGGVTCFLDAKLHPDKLATVGRPAPGSEVFLIDADGCRLPPGDATGEVVGRSALMMAGYHQRPEATAQIRWVDAGGQACHRSGDIGRFDAEGFLTLLDRIKDVIISGGHNIYASDLEAVLLRHADVADAAVIGVPSAQWGETPLALVVPHDGTRLDTDGLREWVNAQVGKHQRLSAVEARAALPRNALGKLSKKELKAPYWPAATPEKRSP